MPIADVRGQGAQLRLLYLYLLLPGSPMSWVARTPFFSAYFLCSGC